MATPPANPATTTDTPITIKVTLDGNHRKFKLPLRELNAQLFPDQLRSILKIPANERLLIERFSDSSSAYLTLDSNNPAAYKQLYRAAKAKLKLRIKVTRQDTEQAEVTGGKTEALDPSKKAAVSASEERSLPIKTQESIQPTHPAVNRAKAAVSFGRNPNFTLADYLPIMPKDRMSQYQTKDSPSLGGGHSPWQVFCNNCDEPMADDHFHCSICDEGDYDLCEACVSAGKSCPGEGHWLIKRFIKNGKVVNSVTERVAPKQRKENEDANKKAPGVPYASKSEVKSQVLPCIAHPHRTCNACVRVLPERVLVTCQDCDDFDLCMPCYVDGKTGHHPGHTFKPTVDGASLNRQVSDLMGPGRNIRHHAICDGCDKVIFGVRNKCLDCPDWDFCSGCFKDAKSSHAGHRFVPVYEHMPAGAAHRNVHVGIFCDGPLCNGKSDQTYIHGTRYKCAICHDTDFCANCEAHPNNKHNITHPLIKFKTQVRNASVTTLGEDNRGQSLPTMGDKQAYDSGTEHFRANNRSVDVLPPYSPSSNAQPGGKTEITTGAKALPIKLDAQFIADRLLDGTVLPPETDFIQSWVMSNNGSEEWPISCSVRQNGGDNMLSVPRDRVATVSELLQAQESNKTDEAVQPYGTQTFEVLLRTPAREGRHISYWRLKAPDGTAFGHKLWCDIVVKKGAEIPKVAQGINPAPKAMSAFNTNSSSSPESVLKNWPVNAQQPTSYSSSMADQHRKRFLHSETERSNRSNLLRKSKLQDRQSCHDPYEIPSSSATRPTLSGEEIRARRERLMKERELQAARFQYHMKRDDVEAATKAATIATTACASATSSSTSASSSAFASAASSTAVGEHQSGTDKGKEKAVVAAEIAKNVEQESAAAPSTPMKEEDIKGSKMVFPTLQRESPSNSTEDLKSPDIATSTTAPVSSAVVTETTTTAASSESGEEEFEDVEGGATVVGNIAEIEDVDDSDESEGFLTDEEYDILDASDEEVLGH